jgi:2-polyprenyl-3-methyl-5-hydroxy-6-metoxy-1,4-benzoquinol methylase
MQAARQPDKTGYETLENFSRAHAVNRWMFERIKRYLHGQILEIGSGIGNISGFLLEDQNSVTLSDLRPEYCHLLEKKFFRHPHLQGIVELDLSLPDFETRNAGILGKFDTVIAMNVVEHIADDVLAIRNAKSLLRKQGQLVILVPAFPGLYNSLDRELGHFRRYTKRELKKMTESAGMKISSCGYFNAAAIPGWWFAGKILKEKIISRSKLRAYNLLVPVLRIMDWFLTPFAGVSLIVSSRKN